LKVRLLTGRVSVAGTNIAGDVIDVPEDEGQRLIDRKLAEPVLQGRGAGSPESAMQKPAKARSKVKK